ncbi:MAG: ZIP family metal transporter [Planctomycetota bacterium]
MAPLAVLLTYCTLIAAASLAGGRLSSLLTMTHLRTQLLMSGVGGLMLGIAMLHLMPHASETLLSPARAGLGGLIGLTVMFLMVRLFHAHDHGVAPDDEAFASTSHQCDHHHHVHADSESPLGFSWTGLFFGFLLHTLVDGVALAASVISECDHGAWLGLGGLGTFLAVALHKPLDAFAITSVMDRQRWSKRSQQIANVVFSLACPIGALLFFFGVGSVVNQPAFLGWGLAISAGFFIGIALADLLPEVAFHDHDRVRLTATFLLGIAVAVAIENLPGHSHEAHHPAMHHGHGEHSDGHSHITGHSHHEHDH